MGTSGILTTALDLNLVDIARRIVHRRTVSPPDIQVENAVTEGLHSYIKIHLKASPLVVLVEAPDIVESGGPVTLSLESFRFASQNRFGLHNIEVAQQ